MLITQQSRVRVTNDAWRAAALVGCGPPLVDKVPAKGELRQGQQLIVTDDSCPLSQIKLVTGGALVLPMKWNACVVAWLTPIGDLLQKARLNHILTPTPWTG